MRAILTYHSIDDSGSPISVSPEAFRRHFRWLTSGRVRVASLSEIVSATDDGAAVAVTFDDGLLNTREPIAALRAEGVPVTVFVVTGQVGQTNAWGGREQAGIPTLPLLPWVDLSRMAAAGVSIEAHTRTHPHLTRVSDARLTDELDGCREDLERQLGVAAAHLAFPYGDVNDAVRARAESSFAFGYTTEMRSLQRGDAHLHVPRLDACYYARAGHLEGWGTPAFRRRLGWIRARRAVRARLTRAAAVTNRGA
jgi:peptidoglycan/xylan/chitin deacetylase (PgdA/CDA1 family)